MNFEALKKSRQTNFKKLTEKLTAMSQGSFTTDERFWQLTVDKAGNGYAIIRFLQAPGEEDLPLIRIWDHGFQGPGGWYIENSLTTLGQDDPCSEYNTSLWNRNGPGDRLFVSGDPGAKKAGSKRRLQYYSNILVIEDPAKPENNGKVFLFRYGQKIYEKLNNLMNPKFPDQPKVNPFDFWEGANFRLRACVDEGYRSYGESSFDPISAIFSDDEKIKKVYEAEYSLQEFLAPGKFKTYVELKNKLNRVLGLTASGNDDKVASLEDENVMVVKEAPVAAQKAAPKATAPAPAAETSKDETAPWDSSEDDELAQFRDMVTK